MTKAKNKTKKVLHACCCTDVRCPEHPGGGSCFHQATQTLFRIDMEDKTGTPMCDGCARDAMTCGVFRTDADKDEKPEVERVYRFELSVEFETTSRESAYDLAAEGLRDMGYDIIWDKVFEDGKDITDEYGFEHDPE